jgi:hypothetical protein
MAANGAGIVIAAAPRRLFSCPHLRRPMGRFSVGQWLSLRALALLVAVAGLLSCGGGVGVGGTGDSQPLVVSGPIEGFGSVIVGGVEFDDAGATVYDDDGAAVTRDGNELRLGMTVSIEGRTGADARTATAQAIRVSSLVVGFVESVDVNAGRIRVLGQTVQVNPATVFDPATAPGLGALQPGDAVAVYGSPGAAGANGLATRVERAPAAAPHRVQGVVSAVDTAAHTFQIGDEVFTYAGDAPPADVAVGKVVKVKVDKNAAPGKPVVDVKKPPPKPPATVRVDIEGTVTAMSSTDTFTVDDQPVDARDATFIPQRSLLAVGARVVVKGHLEGGVLVADSVKVTTPVEAAKRIYRVNGKIDALDAAAKTFVVHKTLVDYRNAEFVGGTAGELQVGAKVRAEGPLSQDGTRIEATQVALR